MVHLSIFIYMLHFLSSDSTGLQKNYHMIHSTFPPKCFADLFISQAKQWPYLFNFFGHILLNGHYRVTTNCLYECSSHNKQNSAHCACVTTELRTPSHINFTSSRTIVHTVHGLLFHCELPVISTFLFTGSCTERHHSKIHSSIMLQFKVQLLSKTKWF